GDRTEVAAGVGLAPVEGRDRARHGAGLGGAERLAPDVEELAEGVAALRRGLDMDHPVRHVGVQPVETLPADHERVAVRLLRDGVGDADAERDLAWLAVDVDRQMGMDVVGDLLAGLAADAVDVLARGSLAQVGERGGGWNGRTLRAD